MREPRATGAIPLRSRYFFNHGESTLFDSLLTQQIGRWTTGSTGFNGNHIVDPDIGNAYIGHCECPWNPYGDERRVPFVIRNLPQYPVDQQKIGGACVHVKLPDDEPVCPRVSVSAGPPICFYRTSMS